MRAIQIEQFGDPAQVLSVVDIEEPPPPGPPGRRQGAGVRRR